MTTPKTNTAKTKRAVSERADLPSLDPVAAAPKGKLGALVALLRAPDGATLEAMMVATGWQAHSVRGALSGSLKKKLGVAISSEKTEAGRVYRIVPDTTA
jgi:hypothetical protein